MLRNNQFPLNYLRSHRMRISYLLLVFRDIRIFKYRKKYWIWNKGNLKNWREIFLTSIYGLNRLECLIGLNLICIFFDKVWEWRMLKMHRKVIKLNLGLKYYSFFLFFFKFQFFYFLFLFFYFLKSFK